jgi:hypothetical protein
VLDNSRLESLFSFLFGGLLTFKKSRLSLPLKFHTAIKLFSAVLLLCIQNADASALPRTCGGLTAGTCLDKQLCINIDSTISPFYMCGFLCAGKTEGICARGQVCRQINKKYQCVSLCGGTVTGVCPENASCVNMAIIGSTAANYGCVKGGNNKGQCPAGQSPINISKNHSEPDLVCCADAVNGLCAIGKTWVQLKNGTYACMPNCNISLFDMPDKDTKGTTCYSYESKRWENGVFSYKTSSYSIQVKNVYCGPNGKPQCNFKAESIHCLSHSTRCACQISCG